jgi:hypothetical protein
MHRVMRRRFPRFPTVALFCVLALAAGAPRALGQMGYTGQDLQRIGQWLQFNGLELYRLEIPNYATPYAAALTSGKRGWRVVVFLRDGAVTNVDWDSGFLGRPFQVASTDAFTLLPHVGNSFGIAFSGCKFQDCQKVYAAMLYLPATRQLFQKEVAGKSVACSASLLDPESSAALRALDAALARQQRSEPGYIAPPCPGASRAAPGRR